MIGALVYLELTTRWNALRTRLQRLRQPRYLVAAIVGASYFYFFFFRHTWGGPGHHAAAGNARVTSAAAEWIGLLEPLGGLVLFAALALNWFVPNARAALSFSEAEVGFLFPAPVTRRALVQFKLIKSQLGIVITSLVFSLFSRRSNFMGGNAWIHVGGWWLILSLFNLHVIGASFTRERLLDFGINPARRRLLVGGVVVLLGLATWIWLQRTLPSLSEVQISGGQDLLHYVQAVLATPPLGWVLVPFRLIVRPFLAADARTFVYALWPPLLLLIGHYLWVVHSDVAFEEASVALSQKRAARIAAIRTGHWHGRPSRGKPRREPFPLAPTGPVPIAFLWKSLIAAGPLYYPRSWLMLAVVLLGGVFWLTRNPLYHPLVQAVGIGSFSIGLYALLIGPMVTRRGQGQMMNRLDVLKAYPLRGWQVVLGELLCPIALLTALEWLVLALLTLSSGSLGGRMTITPLDAGSGAVSLGLLVPPLAGLLFSIPFAAMLYFPVWMSATSQPSGGIEVMGQRLIFFGGFLVVLIAALLPAVAVGAVPFFLVRWWSGILPLSLFAAALAASATLLAEFAGVLWWLGQRYERFDLSAELPH